MERVAQMGRRSARARRSGYRGRSQPHPWPGTASLLSLFFSIMLLARTSKKEGDGHEYSRTEGYFEEMGQLIQEDGALDPHHIAALMASYDTEVVS